MHSQNNKKKGFTLMEMLVVVAIIAILVAIAITTFSNANKKAREATCQANRRSLEAVLATEYMLEEKDFTVGTYYTVTADGEYAAYTCPSGGTISYKLVDGTFTMYCSKHAPGFASPEVTLKDAYKKAMEAWKEDPKLKGTTRIDSNAGTTSNYLNYVTKELDGALDPTVKTWAIVNYATGNTSYFIWSTYPTEGNKSIPVIAYDQASGTYIVGLSSVGTNTLNGTTYSLIAKEAEKKGFQPSGAVEYSSLAEARAAYEKLEAVKKQQ